LRLHPLRTMRRGRRSACLRSQSVRGEKRA
jgi:hypothetical protein